MEWLIILGVIFGAYWLYEESTKPKRKSTYNQYHRNTYTQTRHKPKKLNQLREDIANVTLSSEQAKVYDILENSTQHSFVTGKAGTGKSLLLQYFAANTHKNIVVVAPTGVAAINVGGQTIHSLFRIAPGFVDTKELGIDYKTRTLLRHIDAVVIDEISMVRADLMDGIDTKLRLARNNDLPFGGVQIIVFGDVYQLPPVVEDEELHRYFAHKLGGAFFFNAAIWQKADLQVYELTNIFRQTDSHFKTILNSIRNGQVKENEFKELHRRIVESSEIPNEGVITLAGHNATVSQINHNRLEHLPGKERVYRAYITGKLGRSSFPTESELKLKVGAQVMLLKNDKEKRWVNGTVGIVKALSDNEVRVSIDGITFSISKETWSKSKYYYDQQTGKVEQEIISSFTQFPLRLAWAITIHKSQGKTYGGVAIDLREGAFAHGQTYVAISRCTSLKGLYLLGEIKKEDIIVEPAVINFMKRAIIQGVQ